MRRFQQFVFQDGSGTLEKNEFALLVRDLIQTQNGGKMPTDGEVVDLMEALLKGCDLNDDGNIDAKELTLILLAATNCAKNREFMGYRKNDHQTEFFVVCLSMIFLCYQCFCFPNVVITKFCFSRPRSRFR